METRVLRINMADGVCRYEREDVSASSFYPAVGPECSALVFPQGEKGFRGMISIYLNRQNNKVARFWSCPSFSAKMHSLGIGAVVVSGVARKLSCVAINEEGAEVATCETIRFCPPAHFAEVLASPGDGWLAVGEAGEKLSPLAAVYGDDGLAFGRGGLAASFGAMNLKGIICSAVVAEGTELVVEAPRKRRQDAFMKEFSVYGSCSIVDCGIKHGWFAKQYFKPYLDPRCENLNGRAEKRDLKGERSGCPSCPVKCRYTDASGKRPLPTWLVAMALGSNLGIYTLSKVTRLMDECAFLGLDPVDTGEVLSYLNTFETVPYTLPAVRNLGVDGIVRAMTVIAAGKGSGEIASGGLSRLDGAMSVNGRSCVYDFRGAHAQALFSAFGETTPCHVDLVRGLKDLLDPVAVGAAAAWLRVYTHAFENNSVPAFMMVPLKFSSESFRFCSKPLFLRRAMGGLKLDGVDLLRCGLESVDAFDSAFGEMDEIPEFFHLPGRPGYTDEVNMRRLEQGYRDEIDWIRRKASK